MLHLDERMQVAIRAVTTASNVARAVQQNLETIAKFTKDDRSPVTVADFAVQAIVALALKKYEHALIVGEESGDVLRLSEQAPLRNAVIEAVRTALPDESEADIIAAIDSGNHDGSATSYWTLDPIDGTKGFLRGNQYAISLAWIDRGRVVLGVLGCPNLPIHQSLPLDEADRHGSLYAASLGCGSWEHRLDKPAEPPVRLKPILTAENDPIRTCESFEPGHNSRTDSARVLSILGRAGEPIRVDSQCKYALVARSQADAYWRFPTSSRYVEKVWDHAAGAIVATEAGAIVSDVAGEPLDFTHGRDLAKNRGIVCTAAPIHGKLIAAIKSLNIT